MQIDEKEFKNLVSKAIDTIPDKYGAIHENVVFEVTLEPTQQQRQSLKLQTREGLYGLFEGVPNAERSSRPSGVLPAKITIFMYPMILIHKDIDSLQKQIQQTVWHEVAHYFDLNHEAMHRIQHKEI